jgi:hypothetical protein
MGAYQLELGVGYRQENFVADDFASGVQSVAGFWYLGLCDAHEKTPRIRELGRRPFGEAPSGNVYSAKRRPS